MYFSRMELDMTKKAAVKALSCPSLIHGALEDSFGRDESRKLWRIDQLYGKHYLMVVSSTLPDLGGIAGQFGNPQQARAWEARSYDGFLGGIKEGSEWRFRLTANPTKSVSKGGKAEGRGTVCALTEKNEQAGWLIRHARQNGFSVEKNEIEIAGSRRYSFTKQLSGNRVSLLSVTYEGILKVTDTELFKKALVSGIGRGKAYGQGLLTIAP